MCYYMQKNLFCQQVFLLFFIFFIFHCKKTFYEVCCAIVSSIRLFTSSAISVVFISLYILSFTISVLTLNFAQSQQEVDKSWSCSFQTGTAKRSSEAFSSVNMASHPRLNEFILTDMEYIVRSIAPCIYFVSCKAR